ncbi:o-succinylbenzoate--CoA ligase [Sporolactobacillus vineae]|uniref:o-succinylbenzoate--CoA ligase n=1 Tax=Sporolactobacillus vineae TaxID=444463 RepID=UPI00030B1C27|nr:o-succinylbenzoate--CoA ligase [Sporolactobacillus vineae]
MDNTALSMPVWLKQRALLTPDRVAYETENRKLTFRELDRTVRRLAAALEQHGVQAGSHVAVLQENTLEMVAAQHALIYIGAVCVPLNVRLSAAELTDQVTDSQSQFLIDDSADAGKAGDVRESAGCTVLRIDELMAEPMTGEPMLKDDIFLNDPCTIIYTSGTTGRPKGVVLTYGNHWWNANASLINLGLRRDDEWLCSVPLFHVSGLSIMMKNVIYGMPVYLFRHFDPEKANEQILKGTVTHISVVASMLQRMFAALNGHVYPASLRCALLGGGPIPGELLRLCQAQHVPVYQTYGLTETASQCVTLPPEYMTSKIGSAGKPLFPLKIRIVSGAHPAAAKEPGEILVKGPTVFSHYLNRAEATRDAFTDGWFHTGDIGYLDEDGFLFVLDRRKDLIISGGENVYPAEVESVLRDDPNVVRAGVIGVADPDWGHVPVAFVCVGAPEKFSETALIAWCRQRLAHYKVPKRIFLIEAMPENASHKILRRKLYAKLPATFSS